MPRTTRRTYLKSAGLATTLGITGLAGCSGQSGSDGSGQSGTGGTKTQTQDPTTIRIGHGLAAEEPLWLLDAMPELAEHEGSAYQAKFRSFSGNTPRFQAFQAGELEAGTATAISSIFAVQRGLPMTITASISQETAEEYSTQFIAKKGNPHADLTKDALKGAKIGICDFKSSCNMWAESAVQKVGLKTGEDVQLVKVPFPSMPGAVKEGQVDMASMAHPFDVVASSQYDTTTAFTGVEALGYNHDLLELWFSTPFLNKNGDAVRAFLKDYQNAIQYYKNNMREAKKALLEAGFVKTPKEVYLGMSDWQHQITPITESLEKLNKTAQELGWIDKPVDLNRLYNLKYLPESAGN